MLGAKRNRLGLRMANVWVLVAENSRAKLFEHDFARSPLQEVQGFTHSASRLHDQDLTSDLPGRSFDSKGAGRHAMEQYTEPKVIEAQAFAKTLVEYLENSRNHQKFEKLVIMAPPAFLGMLRKEMSEPLSALVAAEVDKNLVKHDAEEIQAHLPFSY